MSTSAAKHQEAAPGQDTRPNEHSADGTDRAADAGPSGDNGGDSGEDDLARCPICQFIEAGDCKEQHQAWTACRKEAKAAGKDYIDECQDHFKAFLQCALDHRDYYEPFLEMLGGLTDEEEAREEAEQGQQGGQGGQGGQAAAGDAGSGR